MAILIKFNENRLLINFIYSFSFSQLTSFSFFVAGRNKVVSELNTIYSDYSAKAAVSTHSFFSTDQKSSARPRST